MLCDGYGIRLTAYGSPLTADSGQPTADSGQRTADNGQRFPDSGQLTAVPGQRFPDSGQRTAVAGQRFPDTPKFPIFAQNHTMSTALKDVKRITTHILQQMKEDGEKIAMITAYDFSMARIYDDAGVDIILVGDSASNVMAGHETTLPITLDQMIYHAQSVVRGVSRALVVVDIPFGYYQSNPTKALESSIRIMKESGGHGVKLEGGTEVKEAVEKIINSGIPVMGHLGLMPQSIYKYGTYSVRAREEEEADKLIADAQVLQEAGCFALVLEKIPASLAEKVSKELHIPVIGIGAGGGCDGQVLVSHDLLGITKDFHPRFLRRYLNLYDTVKTAVGQYVGDVKSGDFANENEQY